MGNQQKATNQAVSGQWQKVGTTGYCDLVRYSATGLEAEQYVVPVEGIPLPEYARRYEMRRTDIPYIVRVYHFEREQHRNLCQGNDFFKVITERIPRRLSDVTLNGDQAIRIYHQSLQGYKVIFNHFRQLNITEQMIGFNNNGEVRVWLNENFAKNVPDSFSIQSMLMKGDPRGAKRPDTMMIDQLYETIRERISSKRYSNGFDEAYQQSHPISFEDAIALSETNLGTLGQAVAVQSVVGQVISQPTVQSSINPQTRLVQSRVVEQHVVPGVITQVPVSVVQARASRLDQRVGAFNNSSLLRNVSLPSRMVAQPQVITQVPVESVRSVHGQSRNQSISVIQQNNQSRSLVRQPVFPMNLSVNAQSQSGVRLNPSSSGVRLNQQPLISSVQYNISDRFAEAPRQNLTNSIQINQANSGFSNILQSARSNPNTTLQFSKRHVKPQPKSERQGKAPSFIQKPDPNKKAVFSVKRQDKRELEQGKTLVDILKIQDKPLAQAQTVAQNPAQRQAPTPAQQPYKVVQSQPPKVTTNLSSQVVQRQVTQPPTQLETGKIVIQVPLNQASRQVVQHQFAQPQVVQKIQQVQYRSNQPVQVNQQVQQVQVNQQVQKEQTITQVHPQVVQMQQNVQQVEQLVKQQDEEDVNQHVDPPTPPPTPVLINTHKPPQFVNQVHVNSDRNTPGFRVEASASPRSDAQIFRARVIDQGTSPIRPQPYVVQSQPVATEQIEQAQPQHVIIVDEMTFTQNQQGIIEAHEQVVTTQIDAQGNAQSSGYVVDYEPAPDADISNGVTYTATQVTDYTVKEDAHGNRYVSSTTTYQYSDNPVKEYEMFIDSSTGIDRLEAYRSTPQRIHQLPPDYQQIVSNTDATNYVTVTDVPPRYVNGTQPQNRVIYQNYPSPNQPYTNVQMSYKQPSQPVSQVLKNIQTAAPIPSYQQMSQMLRGNTQVTHIEPVQVPPMQQEIKGLKLD